jgi:hypothetical protein
MPVIPATQEAKIGGLRFQASLGKKQFTSPHLNGKKAGYGSDPIILAMVERLKQEDRGPGQPGQKARPPHLQNN